MPDDIVEVGPWFTAEGARASHPETGPFLLVGKKRTPPYSPPRRE